MKTIHLVLKHKWYDMIESEEKLEEYRECTEYWIKRLLGTTKCIFAPARQNVPQKLPIKDGMTVTFHRGYTSTTMIFEVKFLAYGYGLPWWGAPKEKCFIIKLGKRLDNGEI